MHWSSCWASRSPAVQAECKAVCAHCPVLAQCRSYGLNKGCDESGVWGGLSKNERDVEIARARRAQRRGEVVAEQSRGAA